MDLPFLHFVEQIQDDQIPKFLNIKSLHILSLSWKEI